MTPGVVALVLAAAVLHAVWNALAKAGGNPLVSIASYQLVGSVICVAALPFIDAPDPASWPYIASSVVIHNLYYVSLARAYRAGDLSQVYPILRGMAPLFVMLGAAVVAGERLTPGTMAGIALVSLGIMSIALFGRRFGTMPRNAKMWGGITGLLIATYTVNDGMGVRLAGSELGFILWLFLFEVVPVGAYLLLREPARWKDYLVAHPGKILLGGIASSAAYGLVIYAMSLGAMAVVSSLRETSVIFAAVIGAVFLREPFGRNRIIAAALIAAGIVVMRTLS